MTPLLVPNSALQARYAGYACASGRGSYVLRSRSSHPRAAAKSDSSRSACSSPCASDRNISPAGGCGKRAASNAKLRWSLPTMRNCSPASQVSLSRGTRPASSKSTNRFRLVRAEISSRTRPIRSEACWPVMPPTPAPGPRFRQQPAPGYERRTPSIHSRQPGQPRTLPPTDHPNLPGDKPPADRRPEEAQIGEYRPPVLSRWSQRVIVIAVSRAVRDAARAEPVSDAQRPAALHDGSANGDIAQEVATRRAESADSQNQRRSEGEDRPDGRLPWQPA